MNKIDMSCLVGSQVLCRDEIGTIGTLKEIQIAEDRPYIFSNAEGDTWSNRYCQIYQHPDYWISNINGDLVLPEGVLIRFKQNRKYKHDRIGLIKKDGTTIEYWTEGYEHQEHSQTSLHNIQCVQVTGLADGYESWARANGIPILDNSGEVVK